MGKLFFRVFLNMFLWLILLINLYCVFSITPAVAGNPSFMSPNYYFGVSSLIEVFKTTLGNAQDNTMVTNVNKIIAKLNEWSNNCLNGAESSFKRALLGVANSEARPSQRIFDGVFSVAILLWAFIQLIGSLVISSTTVLFYIISALVIGLRIFYILIYGLSGAYFKPVPHTYDFTIVNNVLTSLRACC